MCKLSLPGNASFQARRKSCTYKFTVERRFIVQLKKVKCFHKFKSPYCDLVFLHFAEIMYHVFVIAELSRAW